jgi:hypothetical protein
VAYSADLKLWGTSTDISAVCWLRLAVERSLRKKDHFFFDSSLTRTHVATTSYLTRPSETIRSVRDSSCRSAIRQRCCVANTSDVTVLAAGPVVAIVKITSAHILYPFVVVVGRDTREDRPSDAIVYAAGRSVLADAGRSATRKARREQGSL